MEEISDFSFQEWGLENISIKKRGGWDHRSCNIVGFPHSNKWCVIGDESLAEEICLDLENSRVQGGHLSILERELQEDTDAQSTVYEQEPQEATGFIDSMGELVLRPAVSLAWSVAWPIVRGRIVPAFRATIRRNRRAARRRNGGQDG